MKTTYIQTYINTLYTSFASTYDKSGEPLPVHAQSSAEWYTQLQLENTLKAKLLKDTPQRTYYSGTRLSNAHMACWVRYNLREAYTHTPAPDIVGISSVRTDAFTQTAHVYTHPLEQYLLIHGNQSACIQTLDYCADKISHSKIRRAAVVGVDCMASLPSCILDYHRSDALSLITLSNTPSPSCIQLNAIYSYNSGYKHDIHNKAALGLTMNDECVETLYKAVTQDHLQLEPIAYWLCSTPLNTMHSFIDASLKQHYPQWNAKLLEPQVEHGYLSNAHPFWLLNKAFEAIKHKIKPTRLLMLVMDPETWSTHIVDVTINSQS